MQILRRQNRDSLNLDAEVLTKLLGAAVYGPPGSIAKGARAIQRWAYRHRVRATARDGSGLSYRDRITSNGIVRLLVAAGARRGPPRSARPSPAPARARSPVVLGLRVRAKTGTLFAQVSALSGWVWLQHSHRWGAFSILSRGLSKPDAVTLEDELVAIIAAHA